MSLLEELFSVIFKAVAILIIWKKYKLCEDVHYIDFTFKDLQTSIHTKRNVNLSLVRCEVDRHAPSGRPGSSGGAG